MTTVRGRWFPVSALLPGQSTPLVRVYALAADDGLHLFTHPSEVADWSAPVDWGRTVLPRTERRSRNGIDIHTTAGLVVLTPGGGCRCGKMGRWAGPGWALAERVHA